MNVNVGIRIKDRANWMADSFYGPDIVTRHCGRYCDACNRRIQEEEIYLSLDKKDYCQFCNPLE